jgi:hypothetical protein
MGLFDSFSGPENNKNFVGAFVTLADAAKTAATAYAKKTAQPNVTVNVNYEPGTSTTQDIVDAVKRALRTQDR